MKTFYVKFLTEKAKRQSLTFNNMRKFRSSFLRVSVASLLLVLASMQVNAQCVSQPTAGDNGGCPNTLPTLIASGLAPGGQGSNSSGGLTLNGSNSYLEASKPISFSNGT